MFMDGIFYAAISNNLANGFGSFWDLFLTSTLSPNFKGHPPLAFGIQSIFFRLIGESFYVERIYSLFTFFVSSLFIAGIWCEINHKKYRKLAWLPLLIWFTIPIVSWSYSNNILENTMDVFICLSVLLYIRGTKKNSLILLLFSGVMLALGVLTKGLVSLFPISILFWYFILLRDKTSKVYFANSFIYILGIVLPFVIMFLAFPKSYISLKEYVNVQIIGSFKNVQTKDYRFWIVWRLIQELLPIIIIVLIFTVFKKRFFYENYSSWFLIFLALGLSAVVPIMVSLKQSGFYIVPSLPFIAISFALLLKKNVFTLIEKFEITKLVYRVFYPMSFLFLLLSIFLNFSFANTIQRDHDLLHDVHKIITEVPKYSTISITKNMHKNWSAHGYFQRYGNISLDNKSTTMHTYLLMKKSNTCSLKYEKVNLDLKLYSLYKRM